MFSARVKLQGETVRLLPGSYTGRPAKKEITIDNESRKKKFEQLLKVLRAQKRKVKVTYGVDEDGNAIAEVRDV